MFLPTRKSACLKLHLFFIVLLGLFSLISVAQTDKAQPVFENGEAQIVPAFDTPDT
jgi:hypothetical protein